jgi:hypothetical protein
VVGAVSVYLIAASPGGLAVQTLLLAGVIVGMGDNRWNALNVADGCVEYWEDFLRCEGVLG